MRFEDAMTGTLCGGVLLALLFMPGIGPPAADRTPVTEIEARRGADSASRMALELLLADGHSGCTEK